MGRKRSFVQENVENFESKRQRTIKSKDDNEVLGLRMPFSPISQRNQMILRERSVSNNNLLHRSSTPKTLLRRRIFAASGNEEIKTPEKRTLRRFQSFSPSAAQKRRSDLAPYPYKRAVAFDKPSSSKESPGEILVNIPEEEPEESRDVRACSVSIGDASNFIEASFNMSPIKPNFEKLFDAPIVSSSLSFQLDKTEPSILTKSMELSPSKDALHFYDLPRTPPKDTPTKLKRSRATPLKKNLLLVHRRTDFFDGLEKMDMLSRLQGSPNLIDQIFEHLNDKDLINSCMVSSSWKSLIEDSKVLNKRRLAYIRSKRPNKENEKEKVQTEKRVHDSHLG